MPPAVVLVGSGIGSQSFVGASFNTILGTYWGEPSEADLSHNIVIADGAGNVRARWRSYFTELPTSGETFSTSGIFSIANYNTPPLVDNDTTMLYYNRDGSGTKQPLDRLCLAYRADDTTYQIELANERPIGADIIADITLAAGHRNRFSLVLNGGTVITIGQYPGIVVGSEHEFMNAGDTTNIRFQAAANTTLDSLGGKMSVPPKGVALVKLIAANRFLLCGTLV